MKMIAPIKLLWYKMYLAPFVHGNFVQMLHFEMMDNVTHLDRDK